MKSLHYTALGLVIGALSGCQTAPTHSNYSSSNSPTSARTSSSRSLANADGSLISNFIEELASKSSLESRDAFDQAFIKMTNSDGSRDIRSMDDLQQMSEEDQKKLISEVLDNPALEKDLAVTLSAAKQAQLNAAAYSTVHGVHTTSIPNLKRPATTTIDPNDPNLFSGFVRANPAARSDIQEMLTQNNDIQAKTGVTVIAKDCDTITNTEAMENLELIVDGVDHDVQSGALQKAEDVAPAVERQMSFVTGASKDEAHSRVKALSDPKGGCGVFSPAIGGF